MIATKTCEFLSTPLPIEYGVGNFPRLPFILLVLGLASGCARDRLCRIYTPGPDLGMLEAARSLIYHIRCPDLLDIQFRDQPEWNCLASVDVDGSLNLGPAGRPRVDGLTLEEARHEIARTAGTDPAGVGIRLVESRAARIYLNGPINNRQRSIPYRGPERVLDFLWRVDAVQPGQSDLTEVVVIRPNVAEGKASEIYRVNVSAVVFAGDHSTNIILQPSDQVYIGETRRSTFSRLVPDWLLPIYRRLVGIFSLVPAQPQEAAAEPLLRPSE